eukprot:2737182-Rhodomonas_salina.1
MGRKRGRRGGGPVQEESEPRRGAVHGLMYVARECVEWNARARACFVSPLRNRHGSVIPCRLGTVEVDLKPGGSG